MTVIALGAYLHTVFGKQLNRRTMDRYSMHTAHIRMFMPKKKRANKRNKRDKELLHNYGAGLVYNYASLGLYR